MYSFFKILKIFFLPSGLLFLLLFIAFFLSLFNKEKLWKLSRKLLFISLFILYGLSIEPVPNFLLKSLENRFHPIKKKTATVQAIVILGGGGEKNRKLPISFQLKEQSLTRVLEGHRLWKMFNGKIPIIVSGGIANPFFKGTPGAHLMKSFLLKKGIPKKMIYAENKSRNTYENILYTEKILKQLKINPREKSDKKPRIILITSGYHLLRATLVAKKRLWNFIPAPSGFLHSNSPLTVFSFLPSADNFFMSHLAIHEYIGIVFYKLSGYL